MAILKVFCLALLLSCIEGAPTTTSTRNMEPWRIHWDTAFQICGKEFLHLLAVVCNNKYFDGTEDTYNKRNGEILDLRFECCAYSCKLKEMKAICADQSVPGNHLLIHKNTTLLAVPSFVEPIKQVVPVVP